MSFLIYPTPKLMPIQGLAGLGGGATGLASNQGAGPTASAHRYWRIVEESGPAGGGHFPRVAFISLNTTNSTSGGEYLDYYTSPNCSDTGTYVIGTRNATYDDPKAFTHAYLSSVFSGGFRASNYTIYYSDNGSDYTTAWSGVAHNLDSYPGGSATCGLIMMTGNR